MPARSCGRLRGFTALEALLATALLAVLTATVSGALMAGRQQSALARETLIAASLADNLMDEITRLPFADPNGYDTFGPDPGEGARGQYDNMDDYHNYTDGSDGLTDAAGVAYPAEYQGYGRQVTAAALRVSPEGWGTSCTGLMITVTVTRDGRTLATLTRFVTP